MHVAVLIPCLNEAAAVGAVVAGFRRALPEASVYVYDNGSSDGTADVARAAGATVGFEQRRGKSAVVQRMFTDVDADAYLLVDGDGTYDAPSAPRLVDAMQRHQADMVIAVRRSSPAALSPIRTLGNLALTSAARWVAGQRLRDVLSGYRLVSRRCVRAFRAHGSGFELEMELTLHAALGGYRLVEVEAPYFERVAGSRSKLHAGRDGARIMAVVARRWLASRLGR